MDTPPHQGMTEAELHGVLDALRSAEALKQTLRNSRTSSGRVESTAEHTWRLCLMAMLLAPDLPDIDLGRLLRILVVHDLGEAIGGDIPAPDQTPQADKAARERADLASLLAPLPPDRLAGILALWDEYETGSSPEGRVAKGLDKLETILQHNQGTNPPGFDYAFNLGYGRPHTDAHPVLSQIRTVLDAETAARAEGGRGWPGEGSGRGSAAPPVPHPRGA